MKQRGGRKAAPLRRHTRRVMKKRIQRSGLGVFGEIRAESPGRAARPESGVLSRPNAEKHWGSREARSAERHCLGTTIAPRRRAAFRRTLLALVAIAGLVLAAGAGAARGPNLTLSWQIPT